MLCTYQREKKTASRYLDYPGGCIDLFSRFGLSNLPNLTRTISKQKTEHSQFWHPNSNWLWQVEFAFGAISVRPLGILHNVKFLLDFYLSYHICAQCNIARIYRQINSEAIIHMHRIIFRFHMQKSAAPRLKRDSGILQLSGRRYGSLI